MNLVTYIPAVVHHIGIRLRNNVNLVLMVRHGTVHLVNLQNQDAQVVLHTHQCREFVCLVVNIPEEIIHIGMVVHVLHVLMVRHGMALFVSRIQIHAQAVLLIGMDLAVLLVRKV